MADIPLTCEQTPLAWPKNVTVEDLEVCKTCSLVIHDPHPGTLQILTRRQGGGVGDGVNIEEANSLGIDYRGQRYALDECVFHSPGLHTFPGQKEPYPAEYHVHMHTNAEPKRAITIVIPVSHHEPGPGEDYFKAAAAKLDPTIVRPTLSTLLTPGARFIQYRGPDLRGRTSETKDVGEQCSADFIHKNERQFLLVLQTCHIRASDLERIPREGSLSTDLRDMPAPGVRPTVKQLPRDELLRKAILADPGIVLKKAKGSKTKGAAKATDKAAPVKDSTEIECKPVKVVDGRDVVDVNGKSTDLLTLLGLTADASGADVSGADIAGFASGASKFTFFIGSLMGILLADFVFSQVWNYFFLESGGRTQQWVSKLTPLMFVVIAASVAGTSDSIMSGLGITAD